MGGSLGIVRQPAGNVRINARRSPDAGSLLLFARVHANFVPVKSLRTFLIFAGALVGFAACGGRTNLDNVLNRESEAGGNTNGASGGSVVSGGAISTGDVPVTGGRQSTGGGAGTSGSAVTGGATGGTLTTPTGGTTAMGGTNTSVGGTTAMGGTKSSVGGTTAMGGTKSSVGGTTVMGGSSSMGGTTSLGGSNSAGGVLATGGTSGLGGTQTTGGAMNTGGVPCPVLVLPNEDLIDDMDDGNAIIPFVHGRAGAWSDSHDTTPGVSMFPDPNGVFTMTNTGDSCHKYAAYVYGGPFVYSGADFSFGLGAPYDASAYSGFSFWAKVDAGTSPYLNVAFPDKDTDPGAFICQTSGAQLCWDHFSHGVTLSTVWTKYTIPFKSLTQAGWGHLAAAFDPSTLFGVTFEIAANATFGIWVDDVAFVY